MDYIKEAENYLRNYKLLEKSLENIGEKIRRLHSKIGPKDITIPQLDITGIRGSAKMDEAYNEIFEYLQLKGTQAETMQSLNEIDDTLEFISKEKNCEHYGKILRLWYIEKMGKEFICEEIGYSSVQSIYTHKDMAIRKFAVAYLGLSALKVI